MARGADRRGAADIGGAVARFLRRRTGPGVGGSPVGGDGALPAGALCGEFEVVRVLGVGGFGVTYLARDTKLRRPVAVKEYFPGAWAARREAGAVGPRSSGHAADYRWGLARFLEEARMLARFDHRHIVRVHQVFEARGTAYLVTDYVEGRSMAAEMEAEVALPEARVRALLGAVADGLAEVHGAGLLHRDVKPSNVMLRADGMPVLIDFGAARQAFGRHSGSVAAVLTPGYAPIEQYVTEGGAADRQGPWTDVYALGAVAYAALSGRAPAEAPARLRTDPVAPVARVARSRVSAAFAGAVMAALAVDAADRPQSVGAWRAQWDGTARPPDASPVAPTPDRLEVDAQGRGDGARPPVGTELTFWVGRDPRCAYRLSDPTVSRRHAEVTLLPDGRVSLTDRGSTGGTFVLVGRTWTRIRQARVEPTDRIRFADYEMSAARFDVLRAPGGGPGGPLDARGGACAGRASAPDAPDAARRLVRDPETGEIVEERTDDVTDRRE